MHTHRQRGSKAHVEEEVAMLPKEARPLQYNPSACFHTFEPLTLIRQDLFIQPIALIKIQSFLLAVYVLYLPVSNGMHVGKMLLLSIALERQTQKVGRKSCL